MKKGVPMDEAQLMYCLDRKDTLGHVELCNVLREGIILDQPVLQHQLICPDDRELIRADMVMRSPPGKNSMTR